MRAPRFVSFDAVELAGFLLACGLTTAHGVGSLCGVEVPSRSCSPLGPGDGCLSRPSQSVLAFVRLSQEQTQSRAQQFMDTVLRDTAAPAALRIGLVSDAMHLPWLDTCASDEAEFVRGQLGAVAEVVCAMAGASPVPPPSDWSAMGTSPKARAYAFQLLGNALEQAPSGSAVGARLMQSVRSLQVYLRHTGVSRDDVCAAAAAQQCAHCADDVY